MRWGLVCACFLFERHLGFGRMGCLSPIEAFFVGSMEPSNGHCNFYICDMI
jgi:hypothetical protein